MIEINSNNISKDELEKAIGDTLKNNKIKEYTESRNKLDEISKKSYENSKYYFLLQKIANVFHKVGLSSIVFAIKKRLNKRYSKISLLYTPNDFLVYEDREFITQVYKKLLGREPDKGALDYYLNLLRSGKRTKLDILSAVRYSKEGRSKNIKIISLKHYYIKYIIYKIPIIGYLFKSLVYLIRIPKQEIYNSSIENRLYLLQEEIKTQLNNNIDTLTQEVLSLKEELKYSKEYIVKAQLDIKKLVDSIPDDKPIKNELTQNYANLFDNLYLSFENKFRGTQNSIKKKLSYYLPIILPLLSNNEELLDIGCGRGEWLMLLKENNITAKGIDLNTNMVKIAQEKGLDIIHYDAITYLAKQKDNSLKAITLFHLAEHLPLNTLITLLYQAYRVLKKEGVIIVETPNPENILVGSCSFYTDPTHNNPIPPQTLQFLIQECGFNANVEYLNPLKKSIEQTNNSDLNLLLNRAFSAQDYAIIGYKK